jgi:outer membrane murein-binding lipoprotein Lpp
MNQSAIFRSRRVTAVLAATLMLAGCSVVNKVNKIANAVHGNKAIVDSFTAKMSATNGLAYEATYVTTTGGSPANVTYAAKPPDQLGFSYTPAIASSANGLGRTDIVANATGAFSCTLVPSPGSGWACQKLGSSAAAAKNSLVALYTPSHWVTFLKDFSLAAGFAGDKITKSAMTVHGIHLDCIDFTASGAGTSTLCITSQGIIGYAKVVTAAVSFELKSYTLSPPASLFALPKGAKVRGAKGQG